MRNWLRGILIVGVPVLAFAVAKAGPSIAVDDVADSAIYRTVSGSPPTVAEMEASLRAQGFTLFAAIKEELPEEYDSLMAEFLAIRAAESETAALQAGYRLTSDLRKKHAGALLGAPDEHLHAAISGQLAVSEMVHRREGVDVCNRYIMVGGSVLTNPDLEYQLAFDAASTALFRAIGAGKRNSLPTETPSDEDWGIVIAKYREIGGSQEELDLIGRTDSQSPLYCQAILRLLKAILQVPDPVGRRVRADYAYGSASAG